MKLIILTDYKDHFETKFTASPYRSGFDKGLLKEHLNKQGFEVEFKKFNEIDFEDNSIKNQYFLYTSSEDLDVFYKSYIEDIIYGIHTSGGCPVPDFKYLKAHHNKVFMEILRSQSQLDEMKSIKSNHFGTYEDFINYSNKVSFPIILKPSEGSMSKGISLNKSLSEAKSSINKISKSGNLFKDLKDFLRNFKHKGYVVNSRHRKKFITQNYIEDLQGDWKILIYANKYYVLQRENRKNDFRASGGGKFSYSRDISNKLLDFSEKIFSALKVPNVSIDIGFSNGQYYLIEFQALFFGTYTLEYSEFYYKKMDSQWNLIDEVSILEKVYAESISLYIQDQKDTV